MPCHVFPPAISPSILCHPSHPLLSYHSFTSSQALSFFKPNSSLNLPYSCSRLPNVSHFVLPHSSLFHIPAPVSQMYHILSYPILPSSPIFLLPSPKCITFCPTPFFPLLPYSCSRLPNVSHFVLPHSSLFSHIPAPVSQMYHILSYPILPSSPIFLLPSPKCITFCPTPFFLLLPYSCSRLPNVSHFVLYHILSYPILPSSPIFLLPSPKCITFCPTPFFPLLPYSCSRLPNVSHFVLPHSSLFSHIPAPVSQMYHILSYPILPSSPIFLLPSPKCITFCPTPFFPLLPYSCSRLPNVSHFVLPHSSLFSHIPAPISQMYHILSYPILPSSPIFLLPSPKCIPFCPTPFFPLLPCS